MTEMVRVRSFDGGVAFERVPQSVRQWPRPIGTTPQRFMTWRTNTEPKGVVAAAEDFGKLIDSIMDQITASRMASIVGFSSPAMV
jgi:hypothetical protein